MEQGGRIGIDMSKHIFQLRGMKASDEVVLRWKMRRKEAVDSSLSTSSISLIGLVDGGLQLAGPPGGGGKAARLDHCDEGAQFAEAAHLIPCKN